MKRIGKYIASVLLVSLLTIGLAACGKAENNSQSGENSDDTIISGKVDVKYTSRDLAGTWREENATKVKLSGDSYTIKEAGVYVFSGTLKDGQIEEILKEYEKKYWTAQRGKSQPKPAFLENAKHIIGHIVDTFGPDNGKTTSAE